MKILSQLYNLKCILRFWNILCIALTTTWNGRHY